MTIVAMCCGCSDNYLKEVPPKLEICGDWRIDLTRTKWKAAAPLLQSGGRDGHLTVRPDGTFSFRELPDFSLCGFCTRAPTFYHDGTGEWWTNIDNEGWSYLWLNIEQMDGQHQEDTSGAAFFRREGGKYFLCFTVIDPDSDEVLVLKRDGTGANGKEEGTREGHEGSELEQ
jgi:hypothetical protein